MKFKTVIWFLKNPKYISQVLQVLKRKQNTALETTTAEATDWCKTNCISQQDAILKLTGVPYEKLDNLFPEMMSHARHAAESAPVRMGGEGALSLIYQLVKFAGPKKILETGVAYGWSSLAILLAIKDDSTAKLISNDMPYISMGNDDYVGCVVPVELRNQWELQRLPDVKGVPLALKKFGNEIDFCHYDSDKSYTGRAWASPLLWNALAPGGFFLSDDINDNLAFKHFCESVDRQPVIIEHMNKYVGIIIK